MEKLNKRGQLQVLLSPQIIATILGGIIGYVIAGNLGWDRGLSTIIGGVIGFFISTRI